MATIDANPPAGTRDFLPAEVQRRERAFATIRRAFEQHGFDPLGTPAFERLDVLTGKYGEEGDQLIFKILRRGEHAATGDADLALRYDLTVPLARVVARYGSQLPTPFKRYHIAPVWRADRPGKGRYREFLQCDIDTVGSASPLADASTILAVSDVLDRLGLSGYRVQLNSRVALRGLVEAYGIPTALEATALTALDKLDKIGVDGVAAELLDRDVPRSSIDALVADISVEDLVGTISERLTRNERGSEGLAEVSRILELLADTRLGDTLLGDRSGGRVAFAPLLARGLSYYTGPVFEVVHDDLDATIAAGGRYDGLIGVFQNQDVPATGGSLGIERILLLLEQHAASELEGPEILVTVMDEDAAAGSLALAQQLREGGFTVDVYVGGGRLGKQLKYADRRRIPLALIRGGEELAAATVTIKELQSGEQTTVEVERLNDHLARLIGR